MDGQLQQERGRSPSAPPKNFILGSSPAHQFQQDGTSPSSTLDPSLNGGLFGDGGLSQPHGYGQAGFPQPQQTLGSSSNSPRFEPQQQPQQLFASSDGLSLFADGQAASAQDQAFESFLLEASLQGNQAQQPPRQSINPADLMADVPSPHSHHSSPPVHLARQTSSSGHQTPSGLNMDSAIGSLSQSRHASLDPASAAYVQQGQGQAGLGSADWTGMLQGSSFLGHRRAASDHSDVSSSVAPSPFLGNAGGDGFDPAEHQPSPLLGAQQDAGLYPDALGIERFTISDPNPSASPHARVSPGHSPHISPRLSPARGRSASGASASELTFAPQQFNGGAGPGPAMYAGQARAPEQFPSLLLGSNAGDEGGGPGQQMAPPEINIEFATAPHPLEHSKPLGDGNALSPPDRGRKGRMRAKSDPYTGGSPMSRPMTPGAAAGSPSRLGSSADSRHRSLSPLDIVTGPVLSGASSPAQKSSRRSSTSSIPNRDYILDLADPQRPGSSATDSKRVQKHPATFQCSLCPKRFTRAYNLRSHLRTHTDERPFVCTVCGKAFARQHDRKRHEGLHSGEKKFVCRGELKGGANWGCGRRFARADALGRHFRSEAGRVCIRPLLDEEALERQRSWNEAQMMAGGGQQQQQPMDFGGGYGLPAALLAQYPALATLPWDALGPAGPDEEDVSGRSNYDASSGGEYYDDEAEAAYDEAGQGYGGGGGTAAYGNAGTGGWSGGGGNNSNNGWDGQ
ncbi:MAG: DNA-binding transcription factor [Thelocarpon impressellum]|nr:MAG: DNA-binding transcription factor [Thelocarpon impressellum]